MKLLFKEDIIPAKVDRFGFMLAPILVFMAGLAVLVLVRVLRMRGDR